MYNCIVLVISIIVSRCTDSWTSNSTISCTVYTVPQPVSNGQFNWCTNPTNCASFK